MANNGTTHLNLYNHTERMHALKRTENNCGMFIWNSYKQSETQFNVFIIKVMMMLENLEGSEDEDESPTTRTKPSRTLFPPSPSFIPTRIAGCGISYPTSQ